MKESAGKVLMLLENAFPADSRVRNEAATLTSNGIKVTVIALRGRNEPAREVVDGVTVYRLPRLTVFRKLPDSQRSLLGRLLGKLKRVTGYLVEYGYFTGGCLLLSVYIAVREGFDVVHAHNPPDMLFVVGAFHKLLGKKFVFDHHDLSPELYLSRFRTTEGGLITRVLQLLEWCSVRLANVLIVTNASYREIDIARHGAVPERVFIVRNGPDLKRVRLVDPDERLRGSGKTILGYVGAMNPQDGVDYMLRALQHLRQLGKDNFYCVVVGDGDSREELETLAKTLGLENHVWFTGFIPDADMIRYLSTADICLDPNPSSPLNDVSTWIKVMEYMALGKPVVSFDLKETRTSAEDAAVYVPPNDEAAFAKAVAALMDDADRRQKMGAIGRRRVDEKLSWNITSRNLLSAYGQLLRTTFPAPNAQALPPESSSRTAGA
ncbi:MAG TPA: glycosyltransferase family 4 protein [Vicinamibacterales bacterium]